MIMSQQEGGAAPGDPLDAALEAALAASRSLFGMLTMTMSEDTSDFTIPQYRALAFLAYRGPQRVGDFVKELGVSPATATRLGRKLEAAGLAERRPNPDDARVVFLVLSPKGHDLVLRVLARRRAAFALIFQDMRDGDLRALTQVFRKFAEAAGEPVIPWFATRGEG